MGKHELFYYRKDDTITGACHSRLRQQRRQQRRQLWTRLISKLDTTPHRSTPHRSTPHPTSPLMERKLLSGNCGGFKGSERTGTTRNLAVGRCSHLGHRIFRPLFGLSIRDSNMTRNNSLLRRYILELGKSPAPSCYRARMEVRNNGGVFTNNMDDQVVFRNTRSLGAICLPTQTLPLSYTACESSPPMRSSQSLASGTS